LSPGILAVARVDVLAQSSADDRIAFLGWPVNAWDGAQTMANGGVGARGLPGDGYYHHKRTVREVIPRY